MEERHVQRAIHGDNIVYRDNILVGVEGFWHAAAANDTWSMRYAAKLVYQVMMELAAIDDQRRGREPEPWSVPEEPEGFPPAPTQTPHARR